MIPKGFNADPSAAFQFQERKRTELIPEPSQIFVFANPMYQPIDAILGHSLPETTNISHKGYAIRSPDWNNTPSDQGTYTEIQMKYDTHMATRIERIDLIHTMTGKLLICTEDNQDPIVLSDAITHALMAYFSQLGAAQQRNANGKKLLGEPPDSVVFRDNAFLSIINAQKIRIKELEAQVKDPVRNLRQSLVNALAQVKQQKIDERRQQLQNAIDQLNSL